MKGFNANIEKSTIENNKFRKVLYTGKYCQLVLMSLKPKEEIGMEVHEHNDQFFRFEQGQGKNPAGGEGGGKGPDQGESVLAKQAPDSGPGEGAIWRTLNGHEVGNHGYSQGEAPVLIPRACKARWSGYGDRCEGFFPSVVERFLVDGAAGVEQGGPLHGGDVRHLLALREPDARGIDDPFHSSGEGRREAQEALGAYGALRGGQVADEAALDGFAFLRLAVRSEGQGERGCEEEPVHHDFRAVSRAQASLGFSPFQRRVTKAS